APPTSPPFPYTTLFRSRRNGQCRVVRLMFTVQRECHVLVGGSHTLEIDDLATHRHLTPAHPELHTFPSPGGTRFGDALDQSFSRSEEHTSELQSRFELV